MLSFSTPLRPQSHALMGLALDHAVNTPPGDVPVGAIVLDERGEVIGRGVNRREADADPLAHAEMLAIRQALGKTGDGWRFSRCTLVVTLEPCAMCAGAIMGARMGRLVFGAFEPKTGACGSALDVVRDPLALHTMEVIGGVRERECAALMEEFFRGLRG
ncbi:nucleoside deaminase [Corynebacterium gerontici]|nr:nucleoside deaminase [Corynebacterium gerontici]